MVKLKANIRTKWENYKKNSWIPKNVAKQKKPMANDADENEKAIKKETKMKI